MKKYIIFSVLTLAVGVSVAFAQNGGNPWDAVWSAIAGLQNQIDNIVLTPGPVGPQGEQGEIGPQGLQGEPGSPSWDEARITRHRSKIKCST